jgi:NAD(P)-dependent dehydrogenase (short-subunit alcohol dehydrogenase family)
MPRSEASMQIRFDDRVVIVTGAGGGLGRAYALDLARRGAKVVVNDFGGRVDGSSTSGSPAEATVAEIVAAGGTAIADGADVTNEAAVGAMVAKTMAKWGRVDALINNAGILRDAAFHKMSLADFRKVIDVHLMGSVICTHAVWPIMRAANYGRIVLTTSSVGQYGNFGQANYAAAKMALIGLMNTLVIEGARVGIRVNAIAPGAATRMTEGLIPQPLVALMSPESVAPAAVFLVSEDAPNRVILNATAGGFSRTYIRETLGVHLSGAECRAEEVASRFDAICDPAGEQLYVDGGQQVSKFIGMAAAASGIDLEKDR